MSRWLGYRRECTNMKTPNVRWFAAVAMSLAAVLSMPTTASAAGNDRDRDGMPNNWERRHHLNPNRAGDAKADPDHDGLSNLREYRNGGLPHDEDTDNDGQDDGDELRSQTSVNDADSDNDRRLDGDEDRDRDGVANEDEDDALESCRADDDDRDGDHIADEDENELGNRVRDRDSDDDGVPDGEEDRDHNGRHDEDDDDSDRDSCDGDRNHDGEEDEDEGDLVGTVVSYDDATRTLVYLPSGDGARTVVLAADAEVRWDDECEDELDTAVASEGDDGSDDAGTVALVPGVTISELDFEHGKVEEVELLRQVCA